jgi:hypothetical protein
MPAGNNLRRGRSILCLTLLGSLASTGTALAYGSPGAGLSAAGAILALVGGVLMALVGFVWYPIKRLLRRAKQRDGSNA